MAGDMARVGAFIKPPGSPERCPALPPLLFRSECRAGSKVVTLYSPTGDAPEVECLMADWEPLCYKTLARFLPYNARAAEVGSFRGGSACLLRRVMQDLGKTVTIMCHDVFAPFEAAGEVHDIETAFDANTSAWGVGAIKVKGDSRQTHAVHLDGSLDFCLIDGDHSFDGALADITNFWPKLKHDGWLFVQDCIGDVHRAAMSVLEQPDMRDMNVFIVRPPLGHHVLVAHRNAGAWQAFRESLWREVENFKTGE